MPAKSTQTNIQEGQPISNFYPKGLLPVVVPGRRFRPLMDAGLAAATRWGGRTAIVAGSNLPSFMDSPYADMTGVTLLPNVEPATKDSAFLIGAAAIGSEITVRLASDTWFVESILEQAFRSELENFSDDSVVLFAEAADERRAGESAVYIEQRFDDTLVTIEKWNRHNRPAGMPAIASAAAFSDRALKIMTALVYKAGEDERLFAVGLNALAADSHDVTVRVHWLPPRTSWSVDDPFSLSRLIRDLNGGIDAATCILNALPSN